MQRRSPLSLLIDEVWLRSRRLLTEHMQAARLLLPLEVHERTLEEQLSAGHALRSTLLFDCLGSEQYTYLTSEASFGQLNARVQKMLPLTLVFGYEVGWGLSHILKLCPGKATAVAEACSIFNTGVSLADVVIDTDPDQRERMIDVLNEHRSGLNPPASGQEPNIQRQTSETSVVSGLAAAFFERLPQLRGESAPETTLMSWIERAREAEAQSVSDLRELTPTELLEVSRTKSVAPVQVLYHVARSAIDPAADNDDLQTAEQVVTGLAEAMWLFDDLCDVLDDLRRGALNALTVRTVGSHPPGGDPEKARSILQCLLSTDSLELMIRDAVAALASAVEPLTATSAAAQELRRFNRIVRTHAWCWLEYTA
jgi:hypothetical protein